MYSPEKDIKNENYQLTKISSEERDVINVYRSSNASENFLEDLKSLINVDRPTHVIGDFNICFKSEKSNKIVKNMEEMGFR